MVAVRAKWAAYGKWGVAAVVLLAGCAGVPEKTPVAARPAVVNYALSLQGAPYRYGKSSPQEGFDCSGFVAHVYQHAGVRLPRTVDAMAKALPTASKTGLQSGDLVFFNTSGRRFSHVGIYVDDDDFIHAPSQRTGRVLLSSLKNPYWQRRFTGVRRP
jgi:cell wall-associated NlpC family hydrolase